jgi:hypothetical protein
MGNNNYSPPQGYKVGKVYAVILNDKSVPQKVWEANITVKKLRENI